MFEDKTLTCRECGQEFVFTAGEQEFYAEKGFENEPGRCPECRAARKQNSRRGKGKCSLLFVQLAGRKPRFHSVLPEKDLFIAANVSGKEDKDKWCC